MAEAAAASVFTLDSVRDDRKYFDQILQLIPAAHYFSGNDQTPQLWGKYGKWKKERPDKKSTIKANRKNKKKESLDPNQDKTIAGKQKRKHAEEEEKEEEESSAVHLGKRNRDSGLDAPAKERLRAKIQLLREKRKASEEEEPAKKKQKVEKESERKETLTKSLQEALDNTDEESATQDLQFGKFDYSNGKAKPAYLNIKKNTKATYSLLKKVEEEKEEMEKLKKSKEGLAQVREKKMELALRKVEGEKIKDDPSKIRKTLKRKERQAIRSQEKAADRKRTEKMNETRKVKKREDNIRNRSENKKANKGKRGKPRPGFEGKKKGYINK